MQTQAQIAKMVLRTFEEFDDPDHKKEDTAVTEDVEINRCPVK